MVGHVARARFNTDSVAAVSAARARLSTVADRCQRRRAISSEGYYGEKSHLEETVGDISSTGVFDAVVTRNHYGCLVLNAARTLFIDVDMLEPSRTWCSGDRRRNHLEGSWRRMLDDLHVVLASERDEGFRIYRTAAGFRILATTHQFVPGSQQSKRLMNIVGADAAFVDLCRIQKSFRARLTPKPWRCGTQRPPNSFPRKSAEERRRFAHWLAQYERACCDRATCQYLEHVGPTNTHGQIAPIIEVHDRETKALQPLELA
jgi:hypothetical protein